MILRCLCSYFPFYVISLDPWARGVAVGSGGRGGSRGARGVAGLGEEDEDDRVAEDEDEAGADEEGGEATDEVVRKVGGSADETLTRFEEYYDTIRSRASRHDGDECCIADENERLRFYCSMILCSSRRDGMCGSSYYSACRIMRHGFAGKQTDLDGIATYATSWAAHMSLSEDLEHEFTYLHVRRTMLVCRVVAGRIARGCGATAEEKMEEKGTSPFISFIFFKKKIVLTL